MSPDQARQHLPRTIVLFLLTTAAVLGCVALVSSFVPAIAWAIALAVAARPVYSWLARKLGKPGPAAVLSVFLIALLLVGPALLLLYSIGTQLLSLITLVRSGAPQDWVTGMLATYPRIDRALDHLRGVVSVKQGSQAAAAYAAGKLQAVLAGSVRTLTQIAIMLFTLFFLFRDGDKARQALHTALPMRPDQGEFLIARMAETISASLQGSVTIAAIQGSLGGLIFWALSVPQAPLWAFVMGLLALVPSLGTFLVWMPVAVFLALSGHLIKAAILFAFGAGVIGTVDNLLYPTLVGNRLRLHTIPIFFSVLGGIALFGITGLVLGPLLLTTTLALLHLWNPDTIPLSSSSNS